MTSSQGVSSWGKKKENGRKKNEHEASEYKIKKNKDT